MLEHSGVAISFVRLRCSSTFRDDFYASASRSSSSGACAVRPGSRAALAQVTRRTRMPATCGCPPGADARLARMPASRGCRLTPMLAMTGYSPRAEENTRHDRLCRERKSTATRPGGTAPNSNLRLKRMNFE